MALLALGELCCARPSDAISLQSARNQQQQTAAPIRYELKFQNELDNSTLIKRESQLQIFKCQVRLAPVFARQQLNVPRARFKSSSNLVVSNLSSSAVVGGLEQVAELSLSGQNQSQQQQQQQAQSSWPTNVTLTIDWFRDEQQLNGFGSEPRGSPASLDEPVSVINVELKANSSGGSSKNDKKSPKPRIEIKNTLNGSQLKLTSRLKLNQLRANDSGQYRCLARAFFHTSNDLGSEARPLQPNASNQKLWLAVQQTLESNAATLLVASNNSASGK